MLDVPNPPTFQLDPIFMLSHQLLSMISSLLGTKKEVMRNA
jgi:hypothetical protein